MIPRPLAAGRIIDKNRTADWHIEDNTHDPDYKDGDRICRDLVFTHIEPPITHYIFRDC